MTADAPCRFAPDLADLAHRVVETYRAAGLRLITAESCTAGLIGACLAAAPDSTAVLHGAYVTYCSDLKSEALGVPADLIRERTPYDPEVARRMAQGALDRSPGVAVALSVTGVGGPDPDLGKPAGLVYIGLVRRGGDTVVEEHRFPGPPDAVLTATIRAALSLALAHAPGTGRGAGGS
ncbi:CinA family protein [Azospirillum sp. RWY-5-1]|uniref:CinA family protein n=1 Tax=Azospirillum oleiclasticum TaxID=2735135 RepID=A0ABX2T6K0_9PROT|nr:CinA family protein [Azospirillum oleiclasticum]NYZ19677.1 CinA family protein [Azospirillum oleiclasticum]